MDFTDCIGKAYSGANGKKIAVEYNGKRYNRFVVFKNYLAFYRLKPNKVVYVDRVVYAGRDYMRILFPKM